MSKKYEKAEGEYEMKDIGLIIKDSIIEHNMTQKEVAKRINIAPQTLSHYIHNRRTPNLECFFDLVDLLDLNEQFFSTQTYDKAMVEQFIKKTIPTLTYEQKRILFFITQYMDHENKRKGKK